MGRACANFSPPAGRLRAMARPAQTPTAEQSALEPPLDRIAAGLESTAWAAELVDPEWRLRWCSTQLKAMLGESDDEALGVGSHLVAARYRRRGSGRCPPGSRRAGWRRTSASCSTTPRVDARRSPPWSPPSTPGWCGRRRPAAGRCGRARSTRAAPSSSWATSATSAPGRGPAPDGRSGRSTSTARPSLRRCWPWWPGGTRPCSSAWPGWWSPADARPPCSSQPNPYPTPAGRSRTWAWWAASSTTARSAWRRARAPAAGASARGAPSAATMKA